MNEKHALFALIVREHGIKSCLSTPEGTATFLLTISEAIASGFWITNGGNVP